MDNADIALIQTMCVNMDGFTKREVKDARAARKAQAMFGPQLIANFWEWYVTT
jgi:hypothetical protein